MKKGILITFVFAICFTLFADAQLFRGRNYWRQMRHEFQGGIGVSNFLGELGGADQVGRDFVYDLELAETKFALSVAHRYFILRNLSWKTSLFIAEVSGNDNLTNEVFRRNRNLHFSSPIIELTGNLEFHLTQETTGHRYRIKGAKGKRGYSWGIYGFVGFGMFYYNPKAFLEGKGWVELKPLKTEGQGLPDGPEEYSNYSMVIPMGLAMRTAVTKEIRIGFDFGVRKTFTDYIDDVSTVYYDNQTILSEQGEDAAYLADPNLGEFSKGNRMTAGEQRGDDLDMDSYLFLQVTCSFKLKTSSKRRYGKYRKRSRRLGGRYRKRRSMPSF